MKDTLEEYEAKAKTFAMNLVKFYLDDETEQFAYTRFNLYTVNDFDSNLHCNITHWKKDDEGMKTDEKTSSIFRVVGVSKGTISGLMIFRIKLLY